MPVLRNTQREFLWTKGNVLQSIQKALYRCKLIGFEREPPGAIALEF